MTHVNAYIQDVEKAKAALAVAEAELARAEAALEAVGGTVDTEVAEPVTDTEAEVDTDAKGKKVKYR